MMGVFKEEVSVLEDLMQSGSHEKYEKRQLFNDSNLFILIPVADVSNVRIV